MPLARPACLSWTRFGCRRRSPFQRGWKSSAIGCVKAANSRYATLTTPSIEKKLAAIDAQIDAIAEATATALEDAATTGFGAGTELPEGLKSLEERRKKLAELAEVARTRDEGSLNCDGCPLVALCLQKKKDGEPATGADGRVRNIRRDAHTDVRERAAQRMATPESKAQYARRSPRHHSRG
jgi:hypothetical protein